MKCQLIEILKILVDMHRIQLKAVVQIQLKNIHSDNESVPKTTARSIFHLYLKPMGSARPMISKYIS